MGAPPTAVTSDSESALYIELIAIKYFFLFFFIFFSCGTPGPHGVTPTIYHPPRGANIKQQRWVKLTLNLGLNRFWLKDAEIV